MLHEAFIRQAQHDAVTLTATFEVALDRALQVDESTPGPLGAAMRHAVLEGGKRIRPRLLLAAAEASHGRPMDDDTAELALRAALAVELIHSASLVHDDLPCFDDAALRRGKPTVHSAYGEPLAVLVGDALITRAFDLLAEYEGPHPRRALGLGRLLAQATGSQHGIIGGQSLELGPRCRDEARSMEFVAEYHHKKTAALFEYATKAAAVATGQERPDRDRWGEVGSKLGLAFQLIDDLMDLHTDETTAGKTTGRDRALGRPNGALVEGSSQALTRLSRLIDEACDLVFALATRPGPVLRLLESFDALLLRIDVVDPPLEPRGLFSQRLALARVA